jgi:hypothetical protein
MNGRVLIIAGSDSGGGAGIQADIKTVTMLDCFAMTALTALTAQNTEGVFGVLPIAPDFIRQQIEVVLDDIGADALKTGMLHDAAVIETVAAVIAERAAGVPLVVDRRRQGEDDGGVRFRADAFDDPFQVPHVVAALDLVAAVLLGLLQVVQAAVEVDDVRPLADDPLVQVRQDIAAVAAVGRRADDDGLALKLFRHERRVPQADRVADEDDLRQSGRLARLCRDRRSEGAEDESENEWPSHSESGPAARGRGGGTGYFLAATFAGAPLLLVPRCARIVAALLASSELSKAA